MFRIESMHNRANCRPCLCAATFGRTSLDARALLACWRAEAAWALAICDYKDLAWALTWEWALARDTTVIDTRYSQLKPSYGNCPVGINKEVHSDY